MAAREMFSQAFWDKRYSAHEHVWSGRPNAQLVARVSSLTPSRALDVGCGEGGDAIWLAEHGWSVTGIDVSPVGLARAAENANAAGVTIAARIEWRQADLFAEVAEPFGSYALVNAQYLHMPPEVRERALERLAAAVAPGGSLLVVTHHPSDLAIAGLRPNLPELFHTAPELAAHLDPAQWEFLAQDAPERATSDRAGNPVTVRDAVLHARRRAVPAQLGRRFLD